MKQERQLIEKNEINSSTMVIMPIEYGSKIFSKIFELEQQYISPFKPLDLIKDSCEFFGSSFKDRKEETSRLIGITHKSPIVISPTNFLYFFPTASPENTSCVWIAYDHVVDFKKGEHNHTVVTFKNKQSLHIPISPNSFQNQFIRTLMLKTKFSQQIEEAKQSPVKLDKYKELKSAENPEVYRR